MDISILKVREPRQKLNSDLILLTLVGQEVLVSPGTPGLLGFQMALGNHVHL